ncbi:MAG: hypothetical protein AAFU71_14660 [Cyanobacteria bacterium J06632_22]
MNRTQFRRISEMAELSLYLFTDLFKRLYANRFIAMLKHTLSSLSVSRLLLAAVLTLFVADFIPHPALGPSLTQQVLTDFMQPATAAEPIQ